MQGSINSAEARAGRERLQVVERQRSLPAAVRASISEPEDEHHFSEEQAFRWVQVSASNTGNKGIRPDAHQPRCQPIGPDASWSNFCYPGVMERDQAIARLKEHEAELRQLGIEHLYLFGSTARSDAREDSDVDLFFDHPIGSIGLYELMDVKETASRILGRKADIMTRRSLHRVLRDRIEASALQVF